MPLLRRRLSPVGAGVVGTPTRPAAAFGRGLVWILNPASRDQFDPAGGKRIATWVPLSQTLNYIGPRPDVDGPSLHAFRDPFHFGPDNDIADDQAEFTVMVCFRRTSLAGGSGGNLLGRGQDGNGAGWSLMMQMSDAGQVSVGIVRDNAGQDAGGQNGLAVVADTHSFHTAIYRFMVAGDDIPDAKSRLYLDGRLIQAFGGFGVLLRSSTTKWLLNGWLEKGQAIVPGANVAYATAALWRRGLSHEECRALSNPRQTRNLMFPAQLRPLQISDTGISLPALSLATFAPGSITSSGFRPRVTAA